MCAIDVIATIYVWVSNHFQTHMTPLFFFHIIALNVWLLGASAICVVGMATTHNIKIKLLFALGLLFCFMAIIGNGERSFLLGFLRYFCLHFLYGITNIKFMLFFLFCLSAYLLFMESTLTARHYPIGIILDI